VVADVAENLVQLGEETVPPIIAQLERCRPWLEEALDGGFFSWADVVSAVQHNRAMLWPGRNSAILTEDTMYPTGRVMQVWLAGGDITEILQMAPGIESAARLRGCTAVLVEGRSGWGKVLKAHGYEPWSVTLHKAL
jgi:hypothetical protein